MTNTAASSAAVSSPQISRERAVRKSEDTDAGEYALNYDPKDRLMVGESIRHSTFGIGTVERVGEGKAIVIFPSGARTLACRR